MIVGGNISNVTQGGTYSGAGTEQVMVSGATLRDGRKFRITSSAVYENGTAIRRFSHAPKSVSCTPERITIDGKVVAEARSAAATASANRETADFLRLTLGSRQAEEFLQRQNGIHPLPDTSNDEALARLLSEAPGDDAVEVVSRNVVLGAIRSAGDVHIGDSVVGSKKKEPVKRKRATPSAARKKKPGPLALDWEAVPLAEKHVERDECTVCLSNKRDVACQPCGHVLMCVACAVKCRDAAQQKKEKLQCPECRAVIESAARVYI